VQLVAIDLVFSLDSIITAIGMAENLEVMVAAVLIAMIVMYFAARPVGTFIAGIDHQDAGARVPAPDRRRARGRRVRILFARLYLSRWCCRRRRTFNVIADKRRRARKSRP
jgi:hypothetical protein